MATPREPRVARGQQSPGKRLILFASNKGGVGKTTVCRTVLDLLRRAGRTVAAFDLDANTRSLGMVYKHLPNASDPLQGVGIADVSDPRSTAWVDAIAGGAQDVLLDVPGGRLDDLARTFSDQTTVGARALADLARKYQREVVVVSVVGVKRDAISPFLDAIDLFGDAVHHVVVKNGLFAKADEFVIFDGIELNGVRKFGKAAEVAKEYHADVVWFPLLQTVPDQIADMLELTYTEAADDAAQMTIRHSHNVASWLDNVEKQLRGSWLDVSGASYAASNGATQSDAQVVT